MNSKPFVSEGLGAQLVSSGLPRLMKRFRKHGAGAGGAEPYRPMGVGLSASSSQAPQFVILSKMFTSLSHWSCLQK